MGISASDVIPLSNARANFSELAKEVKGGAEKIITKNGESSRSSGATRSRASGRPSGKLPPPRWPLAQTTEIPERVFRGDQEPWARNSRLTRTGTDGIL